MTLLLLRIDHALGGEQLAVRAFTVCADDGSWSEEMVQESLHPREQLIVERARAAVLTAGDPGVSATEAGRGLWDLLLGGDIHKWWQAEVARAGGPVRTILDVRVEELRSAPWELLARADGAPPFQSDRQPWVRVTTTPWQPLDPLTVPVTVLVVVGDRSSEDLRVDDELAAIHGGLSGVPGRWSVELLQAPKDMTNVEDVYRDVQPDVLHVIGHGTSLDGQPALVMEGRDGLRWPLYPNDVDHLPDQAPRLVVLNACRTAEASTGRDASWTFTDAFIRRGAAAVVAMQGDMLSKGAVPFSRALYAGLAEGRAVDVATALGRRAIDARLRADQDDRCWALPSLSVAADPDQVLPVRVHEGEVERFKRPPFSLHIRRLNEFVDQTRERRRFWHAVDPRSGGDPRTLLVVTGEEGFGKSAMVLSALLTLRWRGRNVVYVDLAEVKARLGKRISWLTVLRTIRDELWEAWVPEAPPEPRRMFDHCLSFLKRHRDPDPWTPESAYGDDGEEFPSEGDDFESWIGRIFSAFLHMLDDAAGQEPLLVVLDSIGEVEPPDVTRWLCPRLLQPVGEEAQWHNLRFVVIGTEEQLKPLTPEVRGLAGDPMEMGKFRPDEMVRLAREFSARGAFSLDDARWELIDQLVATMAPLSAVQFRTVILGNVQLMSQDAGP